MIDWISNAKTAAKAARDYARAAQARVANAIAPAGNVVGWGQTPPP